MYKGAAIMRQIYRNWQRFRWRLRSTPSSGTDYGDAPLGSAPQIIAITPRNRRNPAALFLALRASHAAI